MSSPAMRIRLSRSGRTVNSRRMRCSTPEGISLRQPRCWPVRGTSIVTKGGWRVGTPEVIEDTAPAADLEARKVRCPMAKFQMNDLQLSEVAGLRVKQAQRSGMRLLAEVGIISHGKEVYREALDLNNGDQRY